MPLRLDLTNKIRASRKELFGGRCFSSSHFCLRPSVNGMKMMKITPRKAI